jgi:energy-coupling factor transporter ATP-binding protein EcfA2
VAIIERLEVEEGFLNGLDLRFEPGLNVLIGPRGAGKTSVIELLRFCLDAPAYTERFAKASREHAASVLGGGKVSVTVRADHDRLVVSRSADDPGPTVTHAPGVPSPIVLSQNEIEAVGLDARGRVRIIDGFRPDRLPLERREQAVLSTIRSLTLELRERRR